MRFTTRRGRPAKEKTDYGTVELRMKRFLNLTKEPIDICTEKDIITQEERWAAMHFRWLYTIRFGAPNVSSIDLSGKMGREIRIENDSWRELREREYSMAVEKLRGIGALKIVMNVAVFNHFPRFLTGVNCEVRAQVIQNHREMGKLREGLALLSDHWRCERSQAQAIEKKEIS